MEEVVNKFKDAYIPKQRDENSCNQAGDWIAEVYKPAFPFTVQDILDGKAEDVEIPKKIKVAPPLDPEGIRQIYQRVFLMQKMEEELQKQKCEQIMKTGTIEESKKDTQELKVEKGSEDITAEDLEKSVIWDTEELGVLRKVYKSAKGQISDLKVKLSRTEQRNSYLEELVKKQEYDLEKTSIKLREATKANQRLKIHCDNLQGQLDHSSVKVDTVTEMWKEIDQQKSKMVKEMLEIKVNYEKERLSRQDLELKLESAIRDNQTAIDIAVHNVKVQYERQIEKLEAKLKELSEEFLKEKEAYGLTSKAYNQLRQHFAYLPADSLPSNAVIHDEVSQINHIS